MDSAHVHHPAVLEWFLSTAAVEGWATCQHAENGFIRIVSNLRDPSLRLTPAMTAASLWQFKAGSFGIHEFWYDEVTLTDKTLFDLAVLTGSKQISDAHLAGLAPRKGGRLATPEGNVAGRAVRQADSGLIEKILA